MRVNQWVPAAHAGDAIGDSARRVRDLLRRMGHDSELYAMTIDEDLKDDVRSFGDASARSGDAGARVSASRRFTASATRCC